MPTPTVAARFRSFVPLPLVTLALPLAFSALAAEAPPSPAPSASQVSSSAAHLKLPVPEIETLANGLRLAWFLSDSLPVVDLGVLVQSGTRDDPPGKAGTAELLSASLDRGAAGMSAQQIARAVEMLGASRYASADDDTFSIGMHGLAPDAPALLDLLAKLVIHPDFPEAEVKREHERALDRWSHIADYGETLASLAYTRLVASGTSYERGGFVSAREFAGVGRADVVEFHKRHFTPKNAVLMIVGRVDKAEFRKRIESSFGGWQGEEPRRDWRDYSDRRLRFRPGEVLLVDRPELTQAQARIGFRAPSIHAPEHYALVVANALLGEYFNSRLNALIRDKLALTYSIASSFSYSKDFATFNISSATRNEKAGQLVRKSIDVLRDLRKGPISQDEAQTAKEYLEGGFPLSTATLGAVASRWLVGYVFGLGPEYLNEYVPRVHAVTAAEVSAAVAKDIDLEHLVIVVAGDAREIRPSLVDAGFKRIAQVGVSELR